MENSVLEFMKKLQADEQMQRRLAEAVKALPAELSPEEKFNRAILPAAKEAGFSFTLADCLVLQERLKSGEEFISEDELKQTAGGVHLGGGLGIVDCYAFGLGFGTAFTKGGGGVCLIIGLGDGNQTTGCLFLGFRGEDDPE